MTMAGQDWIGLSDFFIFLAVALMVGALIAYFYPVTYVTLLGTFQDYPYRGYVLGLAVGTVFCFVGSYVTYQIGSGMINGQVQLRKNTNAQKYCVSCGALIPSNANYCLNCGRATSQS